jgi:hypothetical protein
MARVGISEEKWVATCVLVDKLDKVELITLKDEVEAIGVDYDQMDQLCKLLQVMMNIICFALDIDALLGGYD